MYKNLIKGAMFLLLLLAVVFACNKKVLEIDPLNATEDAFFVKETEFTRAVYGMYAKLTDLYWFNGGNPVMEIQYLMGDDVTTTNARPYEHFGSLEDGNSKSAYFYTRVYRMIGRCNIVLEKIEEEDGVYTTPNLKNTHKGEAFFLRGLGFYWLWNFYGTSPVVTNRVKSSADFTPGNSQGNELLDQAILDFTEAASLLPASWPASDAGRATKNAAYGFLGKSLVFRGTVTSAAADHQAAIQAFNQISGAVLVPNFADNFAYDTENNAESLFEFQASKPYGTDNVWLENDFNDAVGSLSTYWGYYYTGNTASNSNVNFLATNKLINAYNPADPRLDSTVNTADKHIRKYSSRDQRTNTNVGSYNNPRILRYADILLLHAEALIQSGGSTSTAIGLINQVRTRARTMGGGSEPANYSTSETNTTTIMNWIMNERYLELACEGQRWYDIRRWHMAGLITLNNNFFDPINAGEMSFQDPKHLLLPIPTAETSKNPNMVQNPGY